MIYRYLYKELVLWKERHSRKVLILRGARQVGKTRLVDEFGKSYDRYLYFNLEREEHRQLFNNYTNLRATVQLLFINKKLSINSQIPTLVFIDEVQEIPGLIEQCRYYHEDYPWIHFILAGSLLEFAIDKINSVPVGRVEYLELHPINFAEYLNASGNKVILDSIESKNIKNELLEPFYNLFHEYSLIGGMPEIVMNYIQYKNINNLQYLYSSLWESYIDDLEKYSKNQSQRAILRHVINSIPYELENRIKFDSFGNSSYKSREIKEALLSLEKAKMIELIYPAIHTTLPITADLGKSPRFSYLDIGLINYKLDLQKELLFIQDLHECSRGKFVQTIVSQELRSKHKFKTQKTQFWVRQKSNSTAEVDLLYPFQGNVIPIEVKSGAIGKLRSLHQFMELADHDLAVRLYKGKIQTDILSTPKGKKYRLLSLPYFLAYWLDNYLNELIG